MSAVCIALTLAQQLEHPGIDYGLDTCDLETWSLEQQAFRSARVAEAALR